jgi:GLPGLI family protein
MKKIVLFFAMTIVTTAMSFAQLEEGHIEYSIEMSSDDPEIAGMASMFNGSTMNLYFSDELARTELDFGSMMSISTVVNSETDKVLLMMGGMMGNKAVLTTSDEMAEGEDVEDIEMTWTYSKETKKILDYTCKKAIGTDTDGNEIAYWYTEKIKPANTDNNSALAKLPGLALEYEVDREGMIMTFTASKVKTSLDSATKASKFSFAIPEGYTEMTYDEFTSMGM